MNPACPLCGLEVDSPSMTNCPKCDAPIRARTNGQRMQVDVAHSGEDLDSALRKLERAIDDAVRGNFRSLKVIHGRGATTGRSFLKPHIVAAMKRAARQYDARLTQDKNNPGAHLLYFE